MNPEGLYMKCDSCNDRRIYRKGDLYIHNMLHQNSSCIWLCKDCKDLMPCEGCECYYDEDEIGNTSLCRDCEYDNDDPVYCCE